MRVGHWRCVAALLLVGLVVTPARSQTIGPRKKIIAFKGPSPRGFNKEVRELETLLPGIDGIAMYPATWKHGVVTEAIGRPFRTDRHRIEDFLEAIEQSRSGLAKAKRYKHNFLMTYLTTGDKKKEVPDWFDDQFDAVINNWKVSAEFCRRAGLKGFVFDDEAYYGLHLWTYRDLKYTKTRTADQYADQAFLRGAQIMRAINTVFPDIHIISLHGPSQTRGESDYAADSGLLRAFFDGLLSECTGGARIIDGHEMAYGYRAPDTFARARHVMKHTMRELSRVPLKYEKHCQAAYSFLIGRFGTLGFSRNFNSNYYTPEELAWSLHAALKHSDEYVWLYTPGCDLWSKSGKGAIVIPQAYKDAIAASRKPQRSVPLVRNLDAHASPHPGSGLPPRKIGQPVPGFPEFIGYDEQQTFGDLWQRYRQLVELKHLWRFRIDPDNVGVQEGWYKPGVGERSWFWITDLVPWDNHGYRTYDGYGWYRQRFQSPSFPMNKKVYLAFGAVAHGAEVYLNGMKVGSHNMDGWAFSKGEPWRQRFLIDVSGRLRPGKPNDVAVRVVDFGPFGGGIWKPVKLIIENEKQ